MGEIRAVDHAASNGHKSHNPFKMVVGGVGAVAGGALHGVEAVAGGVGNLTQSAGKAVLGRDAEKGAAVYVSFRRAIYGPSVSNP